MKFPSELRYTKNDEWVRVEDNTGTVGITDFAQDQLSDIVFVEYLVVEGDEINKGDAIATVDSVKANAEVYSPVSGTVTATNEDLPDKPEAVNSDPYGEAWMLKIDLSDAGEVEELLDSTAYEKFVAEQE